MFLVSIINQLCAYVISSWHPWLLLLCASPPPRPTPPSPPSLLSPIGTTLHLHHFLAVYRAGSLAWSTPSTRSSGHSRPHPPPMMPVCCGTGWYSLPSVSWTSSKIPPSASRTGSLFSAVSCTGFPSITKSNFYSYSTFSVQVHRRGCG